MSERTTVRLPPDLLTRAKRKAAAEGRTLTALIEDGLRQVLMENGREAKRKRVLPPISRATGGLMPGIDITRLSDLQEQDDLDDMARADRTT
jgi:predicted transcriptional regulator